MPESTAARSPQSVPLRIPMFDAQAQYTRLAARIDRRLQRVLAHGQFILGPEVRELEQCLAADAAVRHCVTVGNGTDALYLALRVCGIGVGDTVLTSPFSFVAAAEAARLCGARVIFADIDPETYLLAPDAVAARMMQTPVHAIIAVDLFGQCADYAALSRLAAQHGAYLIEDAAQSWGAQQCGRAAGSFGHIATTSFYPSKPFGAYGDGGACLTDDTRLAAGLRCLSDHGQAQRGLFAEVGINSRLDSLQAAVLLAKREVLGEDLQRRRAVAMRYQQALAGWLRIPVVAPGNSSVWAQYSIELEQRDAVRAALAGRGIGTAVHYAHLLSMQAPYRDVGAQTPRAAGAAERVLSLPLHADLSPRDQDEVIAALREAVAAVGEAS